MSGRVHRLARAAGARPEALAFLVVVGVCDLGTGLGLIAMPGLVLALLGIAGPGPILAGDEVYLRFVGAFVTGVGAAYLYPFLPWSAPRPGRPAVVAEVTALVRGGICLFVTGAVAAGALAPVWLLVAGFDGAVAGAQLRVLRRGWFGRDLA